MNEPESPTPDDWIGRMARAHYNPPPATPREEIWTEVEARIQGTTSTIAGRTGPEVQEIGPEGRRTGGERARDLGEEARRPHRRLPGAWLALAASAILALGVGLGRWSRTGPEATPVAVTAPEAPGPTERGRGGATAARFAAMETLVRSEPLLATVRADASRGAVDAEVGAWARRILGDTRFLLDSGLPLDPQLRSLLEDLELVLLQASLIGAGELEGPRAREELELLRQGMESKDVLTRIQAVVPGTASGI